MSDVRVVILSATGPEELTEVANEFLARPEIVANPGDIIFALDGVSKAYNMCIPYVEKVSKV